MVAVTIAGPGGKTLAAAGPSSAIGLGSSAVKLPGGKQIGTVTVATLTPVAYLTEVKRLDQPRCRAPRPAKETLSQRPTPLE